MKSSKPSVKAKVKKPKLTEAEKREKIRDALLKKKCYEDRALELVEQLLEVKLSSSWLITSASFMNKSYYTDAVEERSLTGLCGYPLCDNKREDKRRRGQFHISLKDKKVYDLEERKLFCSNWCFKASNFFREQLETSPLWLREVDKPKEVTLYQGEKRVDQGLGRGKEVDIGIVETVRMDNKVEVESVDSEIENSDEETDTPGDNEAVDEVAAFEQIILCDNFRATTKVDPLSKSIITTKIHGSEDEMNIKAASKRPVKGDEIVKDTVEEDSSSHIQPNCPDALKSVKFAVASSPTPPCSIKACPTPSETKELAVVVVASALHSWFTIDSFRTLMGDQELKTRLEENRVGGEVWVTTVGDKDMEEQYQARYRDICRKLDMWERLEEKEEIEKLPLPSFDMVREHCEVENLKLSSFMAGREMYEQDVANRGKIVEKEIDEVEPRLPLLDHKSQQLLRRRIVLDKLFRTLPELLKLFRFTLDDIRGDLRQLVNTFQFAPDNVVFKSEEITLMGLFLLKLISLKNSKLKAALAEKNSIKYLKLILLSHQLEVVVLDQMVRDLTGDIMKLVAKYSIDY